MKKTRIMKMIAAGMLSVMTFSACASKNDNNGNGGSASPAGEVTSAPEQEEDGPITMHTMRPVAEGDIYAINKFTVDPLPEIFIQKGKNQEHQSILYLAKNAQIIVNAANYKEDLQELAIFAESASATSTFSYMFQWCDVEFSDPVKTKVAGFDAIYYDYTITQNDFISQSEDDEEGVKTPVDWYKARVYYFYSDKDAFYFTFTTKLADWDDTIKYCEAFADAVTINENAENEPAAE